MKNILIFLTTFIVIMSVGIFVLYDRSTDKEAFKSQVKDDVTNAVSTVVTEANDVKDKIKTNVEAQKESKTSDSSASSDNSEAGKNTSSSGNNKSDSTASTESTATAKETDSSKNVTGSDSQKSSDDSSKSTDTNSNISQNSSSNTENSKKSSDNSSSAEGTESSTEEIIIERQSKADPITKAIVTQAMNSYITASKDSDVKDVFGSMSEEDRDIVADMIAENVSLSSISEIQEIITSGDENALMKYAEKNLSEEDQKILAQIMEKYSK